MTMLGGGAPTAASTAPKILGLGIQTSTALNGIPVAVVLGTNRIPGNMILFTDFANTPVNSGGKSGKGGLGGGSAAKGTPSVDSYSATVSYGLCVGPIQGIAAMWATTSTPQTPPNAGAVTIQTGADGQAPWSYLTTAHPDQAMGYSGLAVFNVAHMGLGESPSMPNFTFEVMGRGIAAATSPFTVPNGADAWTTSYTAPDSSAAPFTAIAGAVKAPASAANIVFDTSPAWCLAELLTNTTWGAALPVALLGDLTAFATWCQAAGIVMSPALTTQRAVRDILTDWLSATISDVFWSQNTIKVMPYADSPVTGTAADGSALTYTPNMTPVMTIDDAVMMPGQSVDQGPLQVTVADQTDLYNQVAMEYSDRGSDYNTMPAQSSNDAHIAQYGFRPAPSLQGDFITSGVVATMITDLALARHLGVQATYDWRMRSPGELLEPFDVVAINDPDQGLVDYPVRIVSVEEEDDTVFHVTAEDIPGLIGAMATRALPVNAGFVTPGNADPGSVNAPVIFEPQGGLLVSGSDLEVWIAVSGASPAYGGCQPWVSTDGATYTQLPTVLGNARMGVLMGGIDAVPAAANGPTIDSTSQLYVDISESDGQLLSTDQAGLLALNTLCFVDGELIAYQTATLFRNAGQYELTTLVRGAYGSPIGAHLPGAPFARLDGTAVRYPFTADRIGQTLSFKFLAFNALGGAQQTLDEVTEFPYTLRGTALTEVPPDVSGLASAYVAGLSELTWTPVIDPLGRALDYEIRLGSSPATAMIVGRTPLATAPILGNGTYWVAAHFKVPNGADIYSADWAAITISGAAITSNVVATYDAAADGWSGATANTAVVGGNLSLTATGDILAADDVLSINDVRYFGGVVASGSYQIPTAARVTLTAPVPCTVIITLGAIVGLDINAVNILTVTDITQLTDVISSGLGNKVAVTPQINLSQDGVTWSGWQNWVLGAYTAKVFDARVLLATADSTVAALLSDFSFAVDVPDRVASGVAIAAPAAGYTVTFATPFNGGPNGAAAPSVLIAIHGGAPGDSYVLTGRSVAGFTIQFFNGGAAVARTFDFEAQGY